MVKNMDLWKRFLKVDFLTNLEVLLKNNGMIRSDLARAIEVAPSTINSWYARGSEKVSITILRTLNNNTLAFRKGKVFRFPSLELIS